MKGTVIRTTTASRVTGHFGVVDSELSERVGVITMLGSLLESRVAAIAMSVENRPQATYARASLSSNVKTIKRRLPLFQATEFETSTGVRVLTVLAETQAVLLRRHEIVHRVWATAAREPWGGHKAESQADTASYKWVDYDAEQLDDIIDSLGLVLDNLQDVVGLVTAFRRLDGRDEPAL